MSKSLKQPIRWLKQGLAYQTKEEKRWVASVPLEIPTDDEAIRFAIRLIEDSPEYKDD